MFEAGLLNPQSRIEPGTTVQAWDYSWHYSQSPRFTMLSEMILSGLYEHAIAGWLGGGAQAS